MSQRGLVRVEGCEKRLRGLVDGVLVVDSYRVRRVWEVPMYPAYYVPATDVLAPLVPTGATKHSPSRGDAVVCDLRVGERTIADAALRYDESPLDELVGLVRFRWDAIDDWLEEDEPIYTHPRDPYVRVDILASSRHVRVEIDGTTVADSHAPRVLFETTLPARFYLPMTDVRTDLLVPTETTSHCPYKGMATYWSVVIGDRRYEDYVWCYRAPLPESQKVAGLLCFYNEKVDLYVDGVLQERPHTTFS